jgi:hypothetical protein
MVIQNSKQSLRGTRQHPIICMPSTHMGLCWLQLFHSLVPVGLTWTTRKLHKKWRRLNFDLVIYVNIFTQRSDYDGILLCKILYFARGMVLLAEKSRWGCSIDQKMYRCMGHLVRPPH